MWAEYTYTPTYTAACVDANSVGSLWGAHVHGGVGFLRPTGNQHIVCVCVWGGAVKSV